MSFTQVIATYPKANTYFAQLTSRVAQSGSVLVVNNDAVNTAYLTDVAMGNPTTVDSSPLAPGDAIVLDGNSDVYCFTLTPGTTAELDLYPGGTHFFRPATEITSGKFLAAGAGSGFFAYSGTTPAAGGLRASLTPNSTLFDPEGNAIVGNIAAYGTGGAGFIALILQDSGLQMFTAATEAGPWSSTGLIVSFDQVNNLIEVSVGGTLQAIYKANGINFNELLTLQQGLSVANGTSTDTLNASGVVTATGGTAATPTTVTTDVPHLAAFQNSWTGTLKYKLNPDLKVTVSGLLTVPAGVSNPSNINVALGTAWQPATNQPLNAVDNGVSPFAGNAKVCEMQTSGVIHVYDAIAGDTLRVFGDYPLDF